MMRGRPSKPKVLKNLMELLSSVEETYGYVLTKAYKKIYEPVTTRAIYYALIRAEKKRLIKKRSVTVQNDNSWDGNTKRNYYSLFKRELLTTERFNFLKEVLEQVQKEVDETFKKKVRGE